MPSGTPAKNGPDRQAPRRLVLVGALAFLAVAILVGVAQPVQSGTLGQSGTQPLDVPSSLLVGASASHRITAQLATPWGPADDLVVQFPAAWTDTASGVSGFAITACAAPGPGAVIEDVSVAGRVTLTRNGAGGACPAGTVLSFTIDGLSNPAAAGPYTVDIRTRSGAATLDSASQVLFIRGNPATSTGTLTSTSGVAGGTGSYTYTYPLQGPWPANGHLVLQFPNSYAPQPYRVTGIAASGTGGNCVNGALAVSSTDAVPAAAPPGFTPIPTVTVTRSGGSSCTAGQTVSVTVAGVKNPGVTGLPGPVVATTFVQGGSMRSFLDAVVVDSAPAGAGPEDTTITSASGASFQASDVGRLVFGAGIPAGTTVTAVASTSSATLSAAATPGAVASPVTVATGLVDSNGAGVAAPSMTTGSLSASSIAITPATATVGAVSEWKFSFTTANAIPANGRVVVTFPAAIDVSGIGATATTTGCATGTFAVSRVGSVVTVARTGAGATVCEAGPVSIAFSGIRNPRYAGTQPFVAGAIRTQTAGAVDIDIGTASTIINAGVFTNTAVTPSTTVAGATATYTFAFTLATDWEGTDLFIVTFPPGYGVAGVDTPPTVTGCTSGAFAAAASGQTVTVTRSGGSACNGGLPVSVVLADIKNPAVSGAPGTITYRTAIPPAGNTIDADTAAFTIAAGTLTAASATPSPTAAGSLATHTLAFTLANPWPNTGKMTVTFPAGADLSGMSSTVAATGTCGSALGTFTATRVGVTQDVTISRNAGDDCPAATAMTLAIANVRNPSVPGTLAYHWRTQTNGGAAIDQTVTAGHTFAFTTGALTGLTTTVADAKAGATTTYTFSLTLANPLPSNGRILIDFPAGFVVSGVGTPVLATCTGTATAAASGQTVTVTRTGGSECARGTAMTVALPGIRNVGVSGPVTFLTNSIRTATSTPVTVDQGVAAGVSLVPASLASASMAADARAVSAVTTYTFSFTTTNAWPANGQFAVTLPAGYGASSPSASLTTGSGCFAGALTATFTAPTLLVTRNGGGASECTAGVPVTVTVTGITNPPATGNQFITMATRNSANAEIDQFSGTIAIGVFTAASVGPLDPAPGAVTRYTFFIASSSAWPANGKVLLGFPTGYTLATPTVMTLAGCDGTLGTPVVAAGPPPSLTLTRTGGTTCPAGSSISVTVDGVTNPGTRGRKDGFLVALTTNAGGVLENHDGTTFLRTPLASVTAPSSYYIGVPAGGSIALQVVVKDTTGQVVGGVPVTWALTGNGTLESTTTSTDDSGIAAVNYQASSTAGAGTILASVPNVEQKATLFVNPPGVFDPNQPPITSVAVTLDKSTMAAGASVTAKAIASASGTTRDETLTAQFTISPDGTCTANVCTATKSGSHTVTANVYGRTGTAKVTVNAGPATKLAAVPLTSDSVGVGQGQTVAVVATDANGNPVPDVTVTWAVASGGGSVAPTSVKTGADGTSQATLTAGPTSGANVVTATVQGLQGSPVTITLQALAPSSIAPNGSGTVRADIGTRVTLQAIVRDAAGNGFQGASVVWDRFDAAGAVVLSVPTTTDANGIATLDVTVTEAGTIQVRAKVDGLAGAAQFQVTAQAKVLASLQVSPAAPTTTVGVPVSFTVKGVDADGGVLSDLTSGATFSMTDGTCQANRCTPDAPGTHTVTVDAGGRTTTLTMTVTGAAETTSTRGSPGLPVGVLLAALVLGLAAYRRR